MTLLIDNYDSFSYNLYQCIGAIDTDIKVVRNDEMTVDEIKKLAPSRIVISPGPGKPSDAGICIEVIKKMCAAAPIIGICLGHQAIFEAFGGTVSYASCLMHGKSSEIMVDTGNPLFKGLTHKIQAARYHSLAGVKSTLPDVLRVIAETDDDEIMGICHKDYPVYGVQFHPESILTPLGKMIIENFMNI
ncbi:MAG: aminodeoxychorismate/anthranilate synthase component II [Treponema sp.]|nr:aminodeoxychorismate/anthranilate synthase component II [Treponema sp.]